MKKIGIVGIGIDATFVHRVMAQLPDCEIIIIDPKTIEEDLFITRDIPIPYKGQLLAYKELEPLLEDLPKVNPNKKPFREGSKFVPLKKRR